MASRWARFPVLIVMTLAASLLWIGLERPATAEQPKQKPTLTKRPDGTEIITRPDGSSTERWPDGTFITKRPDGTTITTHPDRTTTTTTRFPDGTTITKHADGSTTTRHPNGRIAIREPDGTRIKWEPDGTITTIYPDGTKRIKYISSVRSAVGVTTTYAAGGSPVAKSWPDGVREEYGPPRRVILPDGTSIPNAEIGEASDGRRVIRFANGSSQDLPPQTQAPGQPKKATVPAPGGALIQKGATTGVGVTRTPGVTTLGPPAGPLQSPPQQGVQPTKKAPATGVLIGQ